MTEVGQEFHAKRMDCAEEGAVERRVHFLSQIFLEQSLPGALLHFVRRTIGEGDDDQTWQNFRGIRRTRDRRQNERVQIRRAASPCFPLLFLKDERGMRQRPFVF